MSNFSNFTKAVQNLLEVHESTQLDTATRNSQKIQNSVALTKQVTLINIKQAPNLLNVAIKTLLCAYNDPDADVRTVIDECLNKIIRLVINHHVVKVQYELYQEIRRNGSSRSLKAALSKFGLVSHKISPKQAKLFATQLVPCMLQLVCRKEDLIVNVLAESVELILQSLGRYLSDNDIKMLLKTLFDNVMESKVNLRRTYSTIILSICSNSYAPKKCVVYVTYQLLNVLSHNPESEDRIIGVFMCLKTILSLLLSKDTKVDEEILSYLYIQNIQFSFQFVKSNQNQSLTIVCLEILLILLQNYSVLLQVDSKSVHVKLEKELDYLKTLDENFWSQNKCEFRDLSIDWKRVFDTLTPFAIENSQPNISIKVLSLNCITLITKIHPHLIINGDDLLSIYDKSDPRVKTSIINFFGDHPNPDLIIRAFEDVSTSVCHQALISLSKFLPGLIGFPQGSRIFHLFPVLAQNSYFLVKVKLAEIIGALPYSSIFLNCKNQKFQELCLGVLFRLLKDQDHRVRTASVSAIGIAMPRLYYESPKEDVITTTLKLHVDEFLKVDIDPDPYFTFYIKNKAFLNGLVEPFHQIIESYFRSTPPNPNLSRLVGAIRTQLYQDSSKHNVAGCYELLTTLSWDFKTISVDLFILTVNYLTSSTLVTNLGIHAHMLQLCGFFTAGFYCRDWIFGNRDPLNHLEPWTAFSDKAVAKNVNVLANHVLFVLKILHYVIEDSPLVSPNVVSPAHSALRLGSKTPEIPAYPSHYLKLYDALKTAHRNYTITLDCQASELYRSFLKATLETLSQILEVTCILKGEDMTEDILQYLQSTIKVSSRTSILCVRQLLKCLCELNLVAYWSNSLESLVEKRSESEASGFHYIVFQEPLQRLSRIMVGSDKIERKDAPILERNPYKKPSEKLIGLFKPFVIETLIQYTTSNSVKLQCEVLKFLMQLLRLNIKYCLIDADKVSYH